MSDVYVLYTDDVEAMLDLFTGLGLCFQEEKHGAGPVHFACERDGKVFEIYPSKTAGSSIVRWEKK